MKIFLSVPFDGLGRLFAQSMHHLFGFAVSFQYVNIDIVELVH